MTTTMPQWTTACLDWQSRIVRKQSLVPVGHLFPESAKFALNIFNQLVVADIAGKPVMGEVADTWIQEMVGALFGSYNPSTGQRLIQELFLLISKKNSKSTTAAGIMLTALLWNWRENAEYFIIAPTKEVANNSFDPAAAMIRNDPDLNDLLHVESYKRLIRHRLTGATLKILAADSDTVTGIKGTGVLIEEVHVFGKRSNAEALFLEAKGGLASRPEGFVIYLTTQSDEPPAGIFKKLLDYARGVRDGLIEDRRFLPILYEFPPYMIEAELHKRPENFYITNPNMGASVSESWLVAEFFKAEQNGEDSLRGFMSKHLNVEIGLNLRADRWAGADYWEEQATTITLDDIIERSDVVIVGGDGGGLDDLLGMAVLGRDKVSRDWLLWSHAWCHSIVLKRRKQIASRLLDFQKEGDLTIVDSVNEDCQQFGAICGRLHQAGLLHQVALDPLMLGGLLDGLSEGGIPRELIYEVKQGFMLAGYTQTTERKLAGKQLWHGGSGLMAWCVGNAKMEIRGNNAVMTKQASGKSKIDPVIALLNAVALMSLNPESRGNFGNFTSNMIMVGV